MYATYEIFVKGEEFIVIKRRGFASLIHDIKILVRNCVKTALVNFGFYFMKIRKNMYIIFEVVHAVCVKIDVNVCHSLLSAHTICVDSGDISGIELLACIHEISVITKNMSVFIKLAAKAICY